MVNLIKILVSSCVILFVGGCSFKKTETNTALTKIVDARNLDKYGVKNITSFQSENANVILKDSKTLIHSNNTSFTPLALNDKGEVFGESIKKDETVALLMLHVDTNIYKEIFLAEKGTTIGVSGANDNYVLFSVVNQFEGRVAYYCMDLGSHTYQPILKSSYLHGVAIPDVAMIDSIAYISLPTPIEQNKNIKYPLIRYDMKNNKQEIIENETTAYPVYFKNELYYIRIDNDKKTTDLIQYNLQTKKKTILAKGNEQDGYYYNLTTDGITLIVQLNYENKAKNFYKVDVSPTNITPYIAIDDVLAFKGYNNYFTWIGQQENDTQVRKPISFFDSKKQVAYNYDGSLIYFSKKGIFWVKYAIDESKIPKLEIFTKDYSVLMWYPFP